MINYQNNKRKIDFLPNKLLNPNKLIKVIKVIKLINNMSNIKEINF